MELKKALELQVQHYGRDGVIRVDDNGYICLNDLALYYPHKRIDHWLENATTKELIDKVGEFLNTRNSGELKPSIIAKRGKYKSGTYAHELVAMDFAAWLSVEFKLQVYQAFINGTQRKQDWNIKRIMAANNFRVMTEAVKDAHEEPKHYHFSNEALMINEIVFGVRDGHVRDSATEQQLDAVSEMEMHNSTLIKIGMEYKQRKETLVELYATSKYNPAKKIEGETK